MLFQILRVWHKKDKVPYRHLYLGYQSKEKPAQNQNPASLRLFLKLQHLREEENLLKHPSNDQELDNTHFCCKPVACLDAAHAYSDARESSSIWS
jgi:hypothetical protein